MGYGSLRLYSLCILFCSCELLPHEAVSPKCKHNQQWINESCQDIPLSDNLVPRNIVNDSSDCPLGRKYIKGQCREIKETLSSLELWRKFGEQFRYEDLQRTKREEDSRVGRSNKMKSLSKNIIGVPFQCPEGYKPDALGYCRKIFED